MRVLSITVVLFCFVKTSECFPRVTEFEIKEPDVTESNTELFTNDENTLDESFDDDFNDNEDALGQSNVAKPKYPNDFVFEDDKTEDFTVDPEEGDDLEDFTVDHKEGDCLEDFTEDFEASPDCPYDDEVLQQDGQSDSHSAGGKRHDDAMDFDLSERQGSARAGLMQNLLHAPEPSSFVLDTPIDGQDSQVAFDDTSFVDIDGTEQPYENSQDSSEDSVGIIQPFDDTDETLQDDAMQSSETAQPVEDSRTDGSEETPQDEDDIQGSQALEIIPTPMETSDDIEESDDLHESEESFDY